MKKFTAIIAAALAALAITVPVFAENDNSSTSDISTVTSVSSETESSDKKVPQNLTYSEYKLSDIGMNIKLPDSMYILTRDMKENDPSLKACNLTKDEVMDSFKASDTYIKAIEKNFSYDITVTMVKNSDTETVDNLTSLSDDEIQSVIDKLLAQSLYTGCSKSTFNNTQFLTLDLQYDSSNTKIYGIQEYTVIKGTKVVVTFQSYDGEISDSQKSLLNTIMNSVTFDGIDSAEHVSSVASTSVSNLDIRYIYIILASVVGIAALAAMIIVLIKYRHSSKIPENSTDKSEKPKTDVSDSFFKSEIYLEKTEKTETSKEQPHTENDLLKEEKTLDDMFGLQSDEADVIYEDKKEKYIKLEKPQENIIPYLDSSQNDETSDESEEVNFINSAFKEKLSDKAVAEEKPKKPSDKAETEEKSEKPSDKTETEEKSEKPSDKTETEEKSEKPSDKAVAEEKSEKPSNKAKPEEKSEKPSDKTETEEKSEKPSDKAVAEEKSEKPSNKTVAEEKSEKPSDKAVAEEKPEKSSDKTVSEEKTEKPSDKTVSEEKPEKLSDKAVTEEKTEKPSDKAVAEEKSEKPSNKTVAEEKTEKPSDKAVAEEKSEKPSNKTVAEEKSEKPSNKTVAEEKSEKPSDKAVAEEKPEKSSDKTVSEEKTEKPSDKTVSEEKPEKSSDKTVSEEKTEKPSNKTVAEEKTEKPSDKTVSEEKAEKSSDKAETEEEIVFAEIAPKTHTKIKQISEDKNESKTEIKSDTEKSDINETKSELKREIKTVAKDNKADIKSKIQPETKETTEMSEYEKRFGKNRITATETPTVAVNDSIEGVSKFEKYFGKLTPAVATPVKEEKTEPKSETAVKTEQTEPKAETTVKTEKTEPKAETTVKTEKTEPKAETAVNTEKTEPKAETAVKTEKSEPKAETTVNTEKTEPKAETAVKTEKSEPKAETTVKTEKTEPKAETAVKTEKAEPKAETAVKTEKSEPKSETAVKTEKTEPKAEVPEKTENKEVTEEVLSMNNQNNVNGNKEENEEQKEGLFAKLKTKLFMDNNEDIDYYDIQEDKTNKSQQSEVVSTDSDDETKNTFWQRFKNKLKNNPDEQDEKPITAISETEKTPLAEEQTGNSTAQENKTDNQNNKQSDVEIKKTDSVQNTLTYAAQQEMSKDDSVSESKYEKMFGANRENKKSVVQTEKKPENSLSENKTTDGKQIPLKPVIPAVPVVPVAVPEVNITKKPDVKVSAEKPETEADFFEGIKPVEEKIVNSTEDTPKAAENNEPEKPSEPEFNFERDTGIVFEHAIPDETPLKMNLTPFTNVPRLESVNAAEYNKKMEELQKTVPQSTQSDFEKRFGNVQVPKATNTAQKNKSGNKNSADEKIEFYTGYDPSEDPFSNEKYQTEEMVIKAEKKKHKGRFAKSFEKIFSSDEEDDV